MATEYGYRVPGLEGDTWLGYDRSVSESLCKRYGFILIAREVSEPRIVSIRA